MLTGATSAKDKRLLSRIRERLGKASYPVLAFCFFLLLWAAAVRVFHIGRYLLPSPEVIVTEIFTQRGLLWRNALVTLRETLGGFALAVTIGTLLAVMIVYFPLFRRMAYPLIVASQAVPETALAPLFLIWLGFGLLPKIAIAFLVAVFPVIVNTVVGMTSVDPDMVRLARSMGATGLQFFLKIRLPNALPTMLAGIKIATTLAIVGAIVGEFVGAGAGLGYIMVLTISTVNVVLLFAGLVCTAIMGMLLFLVVQVVETYLIPWHVSKRLPQRGA